MRRLLILVVLALAIPAEAARADTGSIAINSAAGDYATATFTVNKTTCASPYYCGWFAIATRHLAAEPCNTGSPIWVGSSREGLLTASETETNFYSFAREGAHRLCLYVYGTGAYTLLAEVVYGQDAPPPPPTPIPTPVPTVVPIPVPPAPAPDPAAPVPTSLVTSLMPTSVGATEPSYERLAIYPATVPYDVDADRFIALVRASASRWDISTGGVSWNTFRFARPDGRNAIGFATRPEGVLGTTNVWSARVYRKRRVCRNTSSGRRCRTVRRYMGRQIVERDVAIDPDVQWQQGPAYPSVAQFDLETVIAHELGHWAGNGHRRACSHLMTPAIDAGDWWRDTVDSHFAACERGLTAVRKRVTRRLEHVDHVHDVVLPAGVPDRAAGAYARTAWARTTALKAR